MNFLTSVEKGNATRVADLLKQDLRLTSVGGGENLANKPNEQGVFPLHIAAKQGHTSIIEILLNHTAKPTCKDRQGLTPLHYAARAGHRDIIQILFKQKTIQTDENHTWTPLHFAALSKHPAVIRLLCENGASLDAVNPKGQTALHLACHSGHKQTIDLLIQLGARIDVLDSTGSSPLELLNLVKAGPASPPLPQASSLDLLSKDMKRGLLYNDRYSDITFVFSTTQIPAHRCILAARAPELLSPAHRDAKEHVSITPTMTSSAFKFLLEWIYTATIEIEEVDLDVAIELYKTADLYKLPHLKKFVYSVVTTNVDERTARTVLDVAMMFKAPEIIKFCASFIVEHMKKIMSYHKTSRSSERPVLSHEEVIEITKHITYQENSTAETSPPHVETPSPSIKIEASKHIAPAKSSHTTKKSNTTVKIPQSHASSKDESAKKEVNMTGTTLSLCKQLIQTMMDDPATIDFQTPVSLTQYPFYADIIKRPMDLGTIGKRLQRKKPAGYSTLKEFSSDVRLVFDNARTFNQSDSDIYRLADTFAAMFEKKYEDVKSQLHFSSSYDPAVPYVPPDQSSLPFPMAAPTKKEVKPVPRPTTKKTLSPELPDVPIGKKLPARSKRNTASSKEDSDEDDPGFYLNKRKRSSDSDEDARSNSKKARSNTKRPIKKEPAGQPSKKKQKKTETPSEDQLNKDRSDLVEQLQLLIERGDENLMREVIRIVGGNAEPGADGNLTFETDASSWSPEIMKKLKIFLQKKRNGMFELNDEGLRTK